LRQTRRREVERRRARSGGVLAGIVGEPGEGDAGAPEEQAGAQHDAAEEAGRLGGDSIASLAAVVGRDEPELRAQRPQRPVLEVSAVLEPLGVDPVDRLLAPGELERP
jgi:hypothetical protein